MTKQRDLKTRVRERMDTTGERYAAARRQVVEAPPEKGSLRGWAMRGTAPRDFTFGVDLAGGREGRRAAKVSSRVAAPTGFASLMQDLLADEYRGQRVRWSGYLKTEAVVEWCALWMRVDGPNHKAIAFDNMQSRPRTGTTDWHPCEVVLDVATEAEGVFFGLLLNGTGTVWMADVALEVVGPEVPVTATAMMSRRPQNLTFDE